jgi:hypothetical protein
MRLSSRGMLRFALLLLSSAGVAASVAFALWAWLPYASLERTTPEERFFLWEGITWLFGLLLIFFGSAAALGTLHLINTRVPGMAEVYSHSETRLRSREQFSLTGVWMVSTGLVLLAIATWARASLLP